MRSTFVVPATPFVERARCVAGALPSVARSEISSRYRGAYDYPAGVGMRMSARNPVAPLRLDGLVNLREARDRLASSGPDARAAFLIERGSMRIGLYAPRGIDRQTPHRQDEVYLVLVGHGVFVSGGERRWCEIGDLIFVAAGAEHRFEEFSDDFELCVMFWGPDGGEGDGTP